MLRASPHDARAPRGEVIDDRARGTIEVVHSPQIQFELNRMSDQDRAAGVFQAAYIGGGETSRGGHLKGVATPGGADPGHGRTAAKH
jgi:hypothetical protein